MYVHQTTGAAHVTSLTRTKHHTDKPEDGLGMLSHLPKLRELQIYVKNTGAREANILCSITSASLQKVTIICEDDSLSRMWGKIDWGIFDDPLCRLADQLKCEDELEVIFWFMERYKDSVERIVGSFPRFREKGRMEFIGMEWWATIASGSQPRWQYFERRFPPEGTGFKRHVKIRTWSHDDDDDPWR